MINILKDITENLKGYKTKISIIASLALILPLAVTPPASAYAYLVETSTNQQTEEVQKLTVPSSVKVQIVERASYTVTKATGWEKGFYNGDIVEYARTFINKVRYSINGTSPETGFDCSGFLQYVYKTALNVNMPHSADAQAQMGRIISPENAKAGDLVWWPDEHIGIYSGNGMMVHSPSSGKKVSESPLWGKPIFIRLDF